MKQNLRDKLLRAGLVDRKAKKRVDHQERVQRAENRHKGVERDAGLKQREREYEQRLEERRRKDQERELARKRELEQQERQRLGEHAAAQAREREESGRRRRRDRARDLLLASMFLPQNPGPVAFHFVSRSGGIRSLRVSTRIAHDLAGGHLAIAQLPGRGPERFGLVRRDVASRLLEEDPALVRFLVRDTQEDLVDLPPPGDDTAAERRGPPAVRRFDSRSRADRGER